jgi:hypothetical protein
MSMPYCIYYQAHVRREDSWFVTGVLRSFEYMAFDRTINVEESIFEFFVPLLMQPYFLSIMHSLQEDGLISNLQELPNRLRDE